MNVLKKTSTILLLVILLISCLDEPDEFQLDLLDGRWKLTEQTVNDKTVPPYLQIHSAIDPYTNLFLGSDSIRFEKVSFEFVPCRHPCLTKSFNLQSGTVKTLTGSWKGSSANRSFTLFSMINSSMTQDTLINGHRYYYFQFINNLSFDIQELTNTKLQLASGNQVLRFVKDK